MKVNIKNSSSESLEELSDEYLRSAFDAKRLSDKYRAEAFSADVLNRGESLRKSNIYREMYEEALEYAYILKRKYVE